MMGALVRAAGLDDYESFTAVWSASGLPYRPEGRDSRESIGRELARNRCAFFLAESDGLPVGVVLGTHDGRKGWINRLAVVPSHRGRGIGIILVRRVEEWLASQGIEIWAALIESGNTRSMAFFAHLGYLHDSEIEYFSKRRSLET